jgi:LSD1 subclass zinc finger protein
MPIVKCPGCRRPLNLPAGLRGPEVQCPACQTTFRAPEDDRPASPGSASAEPVSRTWQEGEQAAGPGPVSPLDFQADEAQATYYRVKRKVERPASWLRWVVWSDVLGSFLCCPCFFNLTTRRDVPDDEAFLFVVGAIWLAELIFVVLVGIGSHYLTRRKAYGLVITAAILSLLLGIKNLLSLAWPGLFLVFRATNKDGCFLFPALMMLLVLAIAAVSGLTGGIKTLLVLQDPEVARDFR